MKTLWFKQRYVSLILSGQKLETIRRDSDRLPKVNEIVKFAVGPRPAFACARITDRKRVYLDDLLPLRQREIETLYGRTALLIRLDFRLIDEVLDSIRESR